jgi:CubicO group peptidase (beta-lactamase class C family)
MANSTNNRKIVHFLAAALWLFSTEKVFSQPAKVETFLRNQMKERKIPGMQVAMIHHSKIVFLKSLGIANIEDAVLVTSKTLFPVHSITKAFTGVAIIQLAEAGKLKISDPISNYLDSLFIMAGRYYLIFSAPLSYIDKLASFYVPDIGNE